MASRRLHKLILAGVFVSGAALCWNLQRDFINERTPSTMRHGPAALALALQADYRKAKGEPTKYRLGESSRSTDKAATWCSPLVVLVSCQDRAPLTMVTLKSALMVSREPLRFVIFADRENAKELNTEISRFPRRIRARASFSILPVEFPASARESQATRNVHTHGGGKFVRSRMLSDVGTEWRQLFKPCSAQRLFLPDLLKNEDAVLYVDSDIVFLRPVEQLWGHFVKMNESHITAAVAESEDRLSGWYPRLARHPYVLPRGINSGVMLLNLTRLRAFDWSQRVAAVYEQWRERVVWGDQDIINIIFSNHSDAVYILPCEWNFRPDHCQYSSPCRGANRQGPGLLHGSRAVFTNSKQPAFRSVFKAFQQFTFRKKSGKLKAKLNAKAKFNRAINAIAIHDPVRYSHRRQLSTNVASTTNTAAPARDGSENSNTNRFQQQKAGKVRTRTARTNREKHLELSKANLKSVDYDYIVDDVGHNQESKRKLKTGNENTRESPVTLVDEDDDDDELSLKERLISPLTIGIFETVNTRCGRFLKAHNKRLTRTLYARAKEL
ncbi:hypothetical protein BIW11_11521 [Tropilaelaps mercedesae]|uniref:UDP-D-xylose:beta-D-glucoside alpha-1,3-D-xylosyltransferase n=1 Tax=Tropilaelaps mercedesae TaxID=418985 RepID=A0A1V9XB41_9ACAR|nr:hypothetical protein BIW11_11521 [Tropilaelaps mercedesae]